MKSILNAALIGAFLGGFSGATRAQEPARIEAVRRLTVDSRGGAKPFIAKLAFSPDGKELSASGGSFCLWSLNDASDSTFAIGTGTAGVAYTKDGKSRLVYYGNTGLSTRDIANNKELSNTMLGIMRTKFFISGEIATVRSPEWMVFSPDGKQVLATTLVQYSSKAGKTQQAQNFVLKLYATNNGAEIRILQAKHTDAITGLAIGSDGKYAVSGSADQTVRLWDVSTGKEVRVYKDHTSRLTAVAISSDSKRIASAGGLFQVRAKDGAFGDYVIRVWDVKTGKITTRLEGFQAQVFAVAFTPDGRRIVSVDDGAGPNIRLWDADTGKEMASVRAPIGPTSLAVSPDGRRVATASHQETGVVRLWRLPE